MTLVEGKQEQPFPVREAVKRPKKRKSHALPAAMLCGLGPCHPIALQCCARMGCFVGVYSLCGLMTSILSMYIMSQITTIEKQFGFSSSQSGFLLSCNDIGYLLTTVFFSYIARKVHIPRTLWMCTVLYGIAGIVCSMSYFISKGFVQEQAKLLFTEGNSHEGGNVSFRPPSSSSPLCKLSVDGSEQRLSNRSKCDVEKTQKTFGIGVPNEFSQTALILIAIGMMIQGLGKAPRYPFLTTYVDDNVKKKNTAMYMGIVSGVSIFGPAIAFAVGGLFSRQYVTLEDVPITPRHPAWIGAWWLGFVVFGVISIIIATPLVFFPKRMRPKIPTPRYSRNSECMAAIKEFFRAMWRLVSNGVYLPLVLATCISLFSVAGMLAFGAKYLETQFFIPAWKANILLGVMNVVAASAGTIVGGFVVTKRQLSPLACIKVTLIVNSLGVLIAALGFVFGCTNAEIVGYNTQSDHPTVQNATCGVACGCDVTTYFPVCGSDKVNYMSPCHAGCQQQQGMRFLECGCIGNHGNASAGICDTSCPMLYPFLIANVFGAFCSTLSMMPTFIVQLRSVSETDKPLAVGFSALLSTLCGWFAGPVVFGMIVDTTCLIWSTSCTGKGACALYDNDDLRIKKHTFEIVPRIIVVLVYVGVFIKARRKSDWTVDNPDDSDVDEEEITMNGGGQDLSLSPVDWKPDPIYKGPKSSETRTFKTSI